nr:probable caffeoyl-CoA O-methyltransferase At4g26220 [Tanacetum cinerariifolium]
MTRDATVGILNLVNQLTVRVRSGYGSFAQPEEMVLKEFKEGRVSTIEFNKSLAADPRIDISTVPLGDGITICRRHY